MLVSAPLARPSTTRLSPSTPPKYRSRSNSRTTPPRVLLPSLKGNVFSTIGSSPEFFTSSKPPALGSPAIPPPRTSPQQILKKLPENATTRSLGGRSDPSSDLYPPIPLFFDEEPSSFHPMGPSKLDTLQSLKLRAKRSIPMLRSASSPACPTQASLTSPSKPTRPSPLSADVTGFSRSSTSSEETVIENDVDVARLSFRKRAKAALGRPSFSHSQSSPWIRNKPHWELSDDSSDNSTTDVDDDHVPSNGDHDAGRSGLPPKGWSPPRTFKLLDPVLRDGSKQAPQSSAEVPYPVCYDKVLMESDDHTHDLIKALIPNRHGVTFHDFNKPPASVLDLGCGEGRWVLEAAQHWKHTRFIGLDLMDIQPDLSYKLFEDIRDRVQWVHSNFLHFRLPFEDGQFDYVRMSHISMAVPGYKWKPLISEIRRVLKSDVGILEWIDEDPMVLPLSPEFSGSESAHAVLEQEFRAMIRERGIAGGRPGSLFKTVPTLLKGRAMFRNCHEVARFGLALPSADTELEREGRSSSRARSLSRSTRPSMERVAEDEPCPNKPLPQLPAATPSYHVPRGLIVLPENKLLPLSPTDVEAQATRNYQVLLGCREALWKARLAVNPQANREEFREQIWSYECGRYERLDLPQQASLSWEDSDDESHPAASTTHPSLSVLNQRRRSPLNLQSLVTSAVAEKPTVVRSIRVFIASGDGK